MPRFILRHLGQGPAPESVLKSLRACPDTTIVDETPRMVLVESTAEVLNSLLGNPAEWLVVPEQQVALPDTRQKL